MKPDSRSTPCRIVFNSSAKHGGVSLNDCLAKGPSLLNVLLGILLRFRQYKVAFVGDISKMFHSIDIAVEDQMTHLFLWREFDTTRYPETYAMTVVNMGDRPSSAIAQIALRKSAKLESQISKESTDIILYNSYMDDIPGGAETKKRAHVIMEEIEGILLKRGFRIKEWIFPGCRTTHESSTDQKQVHMLMGAHNENGITTEAVLGMSWNIGNDTIQCRVKCKSDQIKKVSKRGILSLVNSIYDPLGLLTPFTLRAKIVMRKLWAYRPKIDWDDELPKDIASEWNDVLQKIPSLNELEFRRSITPPNAIGKPMLIVFSDGSEKAYGSPAYVRWDLSDGGYSSQLLISKSRMATLNLSDVVRLELCGGILATRLRVTIQRKMHLTFRKVVHLIDSEIMQAMIHRESYGFNTFAGNRIGEIHRNTSANEWGWIEGKLNIADITTRGCNPEDLGPESIWQKGPQFLELPEKDWPVQWEVKTGVRIPELKGNVSCVQQDIERETLARRIDASKFSKWKLLQYTTARILKLYSRFKKDGDHTIYITPTDLQEAELFWIRVSRSKGDNQAASYGKGWHHSCWWTHREMDSMHMEPAAVLALS